MTNSIFVLIDEFVSLKRSQSIKYVDQEHQLKQFFANFTDNEITTITTQSLLNHCELYSKSHPRSAFRGLNIVYEFLTFLKYKGYVIPEIPKPVNPIRTPYRPHIYTKEEIRRFLAAAKEIRPSASKHPVVHWEAIYPIFYLIISTGLRPSEAINFRINDFDEANRTLLIRNSKNKKDRVIPLNRSCCNILSNYKVAFLNKSNEEQYFFGTKNGSHLSSNWLYYRFRRLLSRAKILHNGRGPRIYDFRHTFATYKLYEWALKGINVHSMLPALSTFMGHKTYRETLYYVREAETKFPELTLYLKSGIVGLESG